MVRRMRPVNEYTSTLTAAVNDSTTTFVVTSATGLPSEGDFYLAVDEEIVLVTKRSGTTLTVIRAEESTTAASHGIGATIASVTTAGFFEKFANEQRGILALPYGRVTRWDGTNFSKLTASDFNIYNSYTGSAISDGNDGVITYTAGDTGSAYISMCGRSFSNSTDWRITAHVSMPAFDQGVDALCFCSRSATTLDVRYVELRPWLILGTRYRSSLTDIFPTDQTVDGVGGRKTFWVKVELDWNDQRYYISKDGVHWQLFTTFGTNGGEAQQIGIGVINISGTLYMRSHILRWHEEALTF